MASRGRPGPASNGFEHRQSRRSLARTACSKVLGTVLGSVRKGSWPEPPAWPGGTALEAVSPTDTGDLDARHVGGAPAYPSAAASQVLPVTSPLPRSAVASEFSASAAAPGPCRSQDGHASARLGRRQPRRRRPLAGGVGPVWPPGGRPSLCRWRRSVVKQAPSATAPGSDCVPFLSRWWSRSGLRPVAGRRRCVTDRGAARSWPTWARTGRPYGKACHPPVGAVCPSGADGGRGPCDAVDWPCSAPLKAWVVDASRPGRSPGPAVSDQGVRLRRGVPRSRQSGPSPCSRRYLGEFAACCH